MDATIANAEREIELIQEYRTRLIADVVTGKLDVREAAANLPDELDAMESVEEDDTMLENGEGDGADLEAAAEDEP